MKFATSSLILAHIATTATADDGAANLRVPANKEEKVAGNSKLSWTYYGNNERKIEEVTGVTKKLRRLKDDTKPPVSSDPKSDKANGMKNKKAKDSDMTPATFLSTLGTPSTAAGVALLAVIKKEADLLQIFASQASTAAGVALFNDISGKTGVFEAFTAGAAADGDMFTGTAAKAMAWCAEAGRTCCTGTDACSWVGIASIASNSCVGREACKSIETQSIIFQGSCISGTGANDDKACAYFNFNSGSKKASIVAPGSCTGDMSCYAFAQQANGDAIIGAGSCKGTLGCAAMGAGPASYANITPDQGNGTTDNKRVSDTIVGAGSCTNNFSCSYVNSHVSNTYVDPATPYNQFEGSTMIGDGTCVPAYSCRYLGYQFYWSADINLSDGVCNDTPVAKYSGCSYCYYNFEAPNACTPLTAVFTVASGSSCPACTS